MLRALRQVAQITIVGLWTIPERIGTSLVIVVGIAGVVGVLVAMLAMSRGFEHTLASTGRADRVIMLRGGSDAEMSSNITREEAALLAAMPSIAQAPGGAPLTSAELVLMVDLPRRGETSPNNVPVRGVGPASFEIRGELAIVEGRRFEPGRLEVIVGRKAAAEFEGLTVGRKIKLRDSLWDVVGVFASGGDVHETEIWADAETAMSAFRRGGFQSLTAKLDSDSAASFQTLRHTVASDPRFSIKVLREPEYYAKQSETLATLINVLGYLVSTFMAVGATFGALNCMYSAVASRQVEIATLRAIGFGGFPVLVSVMVEALVLASIGGLIGACAAAVYCNGASLSTLNFNTFSQVAFEFRVTPGLVLEGMGWALAIGAIGGLFPAIRAVRMPVVEALRTS
jgi:putative ABC transport system permease protein